MLETAPLPVGAARRLPGRDDALAVPCRRLALSVCGTCGLLRQTAADGDEPPPSRGAVPAAECLDTRHETIERLIDVHHLRGRRLLSIGRGGHEFLRRLCQYGNNYGMGVDPDVGQPGIEAVGGTQVRWIRDRFRPEHAQLDVDLVCCLNLLEHLPEAAGFLATLRHALADRQVPIYLETADRRTAFCSAPVWDFPFDAINYFGLDELVTLVQRAGFTVLDAGPCDDLPGQWFVEAATGLERLNWAGSDSEPAPRVAQLLAAANSHREALAQWNNQWAAWIDQRCRVAVWGAGPREARWLNLVSAGAAVVCLVDPEGSLNGQFLAGVGQPIVAADLLPDFAPDVVLLLDAAQRASANQLLDRLGLGGRLVVA